MPTFIKATNMKRHLAKQHTFYSALMDRSSVARIHAVTLEVRGNPDVKLVLLEKVLVEEVSWRDGRGGRVRSRNGGSGLWSSASIVVNPDKAIQAAAFLSRFCVAVPLWIKGQAGFWQITDPLILTERMAPLMRRRAVASFTNWKQTQHNFEVKFSFVTATTQCCLCSLRNLPPPLRA
jgi:hypothetical protein